MLESGKMGYVCSKMLAFNLLSLKIFYGLFLWEKKKEQPSDFMFDICATHALLCPGQLH